jgi:hypothetical protein
MSKGSDRRPGKGYGEGHDLAFKPCPNCEQLNATNAALDAANDKYRDAIDAIYNDSDISNGRRTVIKHFGLWHPQVALKDTNAALVAENKKADEWIATLSFQVEALTDKTRQRKEALSKWVMHYGERCSVCMEASVEALKDTYDERL